MENSGGPAGPVLERRSRICAAHRPGAGDRAEHFLVSDAALLEQALKDRPAPLSGRVSFLPVDMPVSAREGSHPAPRRAAERDPLPDHPGVVAAAGDLVHCDRPELADLPGRLLSNTLIVKDLEAARALANATIGYRFVTLAGELLETDGVLTVGIHQAERGLLSRKSELRELARASCLDRCQDRRGRSAS